jgi:hypothetical protein
MIQRIGIYPEAGEWTTVGIFALPIGVCLLIDRLEVDGEHVPGGHVIGRYRDDLETALRHGELFVLGHAGQLGVEPEHVDGGRVPEHLVPALSA